MRKMQICYMIYTKVSGYNVLKINAMTKEGIDGLKEVLKGNTSVLARTIWSSVNQL